MNPPEFARHWAYELGGKNAALVQLSGGNNNHVFQCSTHDYNWVIKGYPFQEEGKRNRMQAEVEFLRYAELVAPEKVPKLIGIDIDRNCVILEHIEGQVFPEGVPPAKEAISLAVDFFRQLNAEHATANQMISMPAAEGYIRLSEHIKNIKQRLNDMDCEHLHAEAKPQAKYMLANLVGKHEQIQETIERKISRGDLVDELQPEELCVSPSDFGFHNAILTKNGVVFFDFEFAGWDDPAKTILDFILQPRVPSYQEPSPLRMSIQEKKLTSAFDRRYEALKPILKLKWVCIILSVLSRERLEKLKRLTSDLDVTNLINQRLSIAVSYCKATSSLDML